MKKLTKEEALESYKMIRNVITAKPDEAEKNLPLKKKGLEFIDATIKELEKQLRDEKRQEQ